MLLVLVMVVLVIVVLTFEQSAESQNTRKTYLSSIPLLI